MPFFVLPPGMAIFQQSEHDTELENGVARNIENRHTRTSSAEASIRDGLRRVDLSRGSALYRDLLGLRFQLMDFNSILDANHELIETEE